jgi:ABC-2 type transport system permease protein
VVILAFTNTIILSTVIDLLFLYIIGFQLLTLVNELKKVPLFQIYPISDDEKIKAVQKLIFQFLFIVSILLVFASLNGIGLLGLSLGILGFLFAYLFSYFYAARRIKA